MNKREIGAEYEAVAASYLENQGMVLLHKNFRCRQGEVDLVGLHQGCLVFVEVKYRPTLSDGWDAITARQSVRLRNAAENYIAKNAWRGDARFDVIVVCGWRIHWARGAI